MTEEWTCPPPTGEKKTFIVRVEINTTIEMDTSLTPDEEWQNQFFNASLADLAVHIVHNRVISNFSDTEGLWPEQENNPEYYRILNTGMNNYYVETEEIPNHNQNIE